MTQRYNKVALLHNAWLKKGITYMRMITNVYVKVSALTRKGVDNRNRLEGVGCITW